MHPTHLSRRQWIGGVAATACASQVFLNQTLFGAEGDQPAKGKKLLFLTKSSGFQHSVVKREGDAPAFAERVMMMWPSAKALN